MNLHDYNIILINTSAGKDSQTMMRYIVKLAEEQAYPKDRLIAVHADLGRVEWQGTRDLAQRQSEHYGLRFEHVARPQGDLLDHIESRGMFPSATTRYCTSDHKRDQVAKIITMLHKEWVGGRWIRKRMTFKVLSCMGFRAQESSVRAKKVVLTRDKRHSTQTRTVDIWLPILGWTAYAVWADIK